MMYECTLNEKVREITETGQNYNFTTTSTKGFPEILLTCWKV